MDIGKIKNANTKKIAKQIEYFEQIESTNVYAKTIASDVKNSGKLIIAEEQTSGIGTNGRSWYTGSGKNIAMTIILNPKCNINKLEGITIKIAEIIQESIKEVCNCETKIKEPNDLMLNGKKIAGILTETSIQGNEVNFLIIGIGINVNEEYFSKETITIATSLKKELKKEFSREDIIIKIIEKLEKEE